jgi:hypothetical protein
MPRLGARAALLLLLAAAAATAPLAAAQTCGNIDALGAGRASGKGIKDDTAALQDMDRDAAIGLIYLPPGAYRVARSLSLRKPVFGEAGAYFIVESGATLTLESQPEYPLWAKLFELRGGCASVCWWKAGRGHGVAHPWAIVASSSGGGSLGSAATTLLPLHCCPPDVSGCRQRHRQIWF